MLVSVYLKKQPLFSVSVDWIHTWEDHHQLAWLEILVELSKFFGGCVFSLNLSV